MHTQPAGAKAAADRQLGRSAGAGCGAAPARGSGSAAAHPGGRLHTTAKTAPPPVPSGAMGMGVSQLVKEPHTCTCARVHASARRRDAARSRRGGPECMGRGWWRSRQPAQRGRASTRLPAAIGPHEARRHQLAGRRGLLHSCRPPGVGFRRSAAGARRGVPRTPPPPPLSAPLRNDLRTSRGAQRHRSGSLCRFPLLSWKVPLSYDQRASPRQCCRQLRAVWQHGARADETARRSSNLGSPLQRLLQLAQLSGLRVHGHAAALALAAAALLERRERGHGEHAAHARNPILLLRLAACVQTHGRAALSRRTGRQRSERSRKHSAAQRRDSKGASMSRSTHRSGALACQPPLRRRQRGRWRPLAPAPQQ